MRTCKLFWAAVAMTVPAAAHAQFDTRRAETMSWIDYAGRPQMTETPNEGNTHLNFQLLTQNTDYFRGAFDGVEAGLDDYAVSIDPTLVFTLFDQGDVNPVRFNLVLGAQNSVSAADRFRDSATGPRIWYEANPFLGGIFEVGPGLRLGAVYTAYTSPNGVLETRQETAVTVGYGNNRNAFGRLQPYGLVAFQLDEAADGSQGFYAEAGFRPQFDLAQSGMGEFQLAFPILAGVALDDYYGDLGDDFPLFVRAGLQGSLALGTVNSDYGAWRLIAGADMLWRETALEGVVFPSGNINRQADDAGNFVWTGQLGLNVAY